MSRLPCSTEPHHGQRASCIGDEPREPPLRWRACLTHSSASSVRFGVEARPTQSPIRIGV
jgi:hypothetical protein